MKVILQGDMEETLWRGSSQHLGEKDLSDHGQYVQDSIASTEHPLMSFTPINQPRITPQFVNPRQTIREDIASDSWYNTIDESEYVNRQSTEPTKGPRSRKRRSPSALHQEVEDDWRETLKVEEDVRRRPEPKRRKAAPAKGIKNISKNKNALGSIDERGVPQFATDDQSTCVTTAPRNPSKRPKPKASKISLQSQPGPFKPLTISKPITLENLNSEKPQPTSPLTPSKQVPAISPNTLQIQTPSHNHHLRLTTEQSVRIHSQSGSVSKPSLSRLHSWRHVSLVNDGVSTILDHQSPQISGMIPTEEFDTSLSKICQKPVNPAIVGAMAEPQNLMSNKDSASQENFMYNEASLQSSLPTCGMVISDGDQCKAQQLDAAQASLPKDSGLSLDSAHCIASSSSVNEVDTAVGENANPLSFGNITFARLDPSFDVVEFRDPTKLTEETTSTSQNSLRNDTPSAESFAVENSPLNYKNQSDSDPTVTGIFQSDSSVPTGPLNRSVDLYRLKEPKSQCLDTRKNVRKCMSQTIFHDYRERPTSEWNPSPPSAQPQVESSSSQDNETCEHLPSLTKDNHAYCASIPSDSDEYDEGLHDEDFIEALPKFDDRVCHDASDAPSSLRSSTNKIKFTPRLGEQHRQNNNFDDLIKDPDIDDEFPFDEAEEEELLRLSEIPINTLPNSLSRQQVHLQRYPIDASEVIPMTPNISPHRQIHTDRYSTPGTRPVSTFPHSTFSSPMKASNLPPGLSTKTKERVTHALAQISGFRSGRDIEIHEDEPAAVSTVSLQRQCEKTFSPPTTIRIAQQQRVHEDDDDYRPLKPFARPNFPNLVRDRSPILGLSSQTLLRTCFKIGEMFKEGKRCAGLSQDAIIEIFARVMSSTREPGSTKQHFIFADLWKDNPPFPEGLLMNYKTTGLADTESKVFVGSHGKMARCLGRLKRDAKNSTTGWLIHIITIRETDWEEIRYTKTVVSAGGVKSESV